MRPKGLHFILITAGSENGGFTGVIAAVKKWMIESTNSDSYERQTESQ